MLASVTSGGVVALAGEAPKPVTSKAADAMIALNFFSMTNSLAFGRGTKAAPICVDSHISGNSEHLSNELGAINKR
jgi:hypothetical protein